MNCRQRRDLISAYLDQELTGQQMLEMHTHLGVCADCARECREMRDVRRLLRAAAPFHPPAAARERLVAQLDREAAPAMSLAALTAPLLHWWTMLDEDQPAVGVRPRGRRLVSALALSSVAILAVAAPFAPSTGDAVGRGFSSVVTQAGLGTTPWLPPSAGEGFFSSLRLAGAPAAQPPPALSQTYAQTAAQSMDAEPLRDEAVSDYAQGSVTLVDFQSPATGGR